MQRSMPVKVTFYPFGPRTGHEQAGGIFFSLFEDGGEMRLVLETDDAAELGERLIFMAEVARNLNRNTEPAAS